MSDLSYSPPPVASTSKKRKSTGRAAPAKKRAKTQPDPFANSKSIIQNVIASPDSFELPEDEEEIRGWMLSIAQYAKSLEGSVAVSGGSGTSGLGPPPKTPEQIATEVKRVADMVNKGISKQMSWKPNCKTDRATFAFDGLCPDARVFGAMLKLDGPPTFRQKKFTQEEFRGMVGRVSKSARYSELGLSKRDVNVRWNPDTGEFKISGFYGQGGGY